MKTLIDDIIQSPGGVLNLDHNDFKVENDVRWCSGCGSYAILSQIQKILPELGIPKEKFVFISGIGCSGRFSYYVDVYGFHGIHGRALSIASGLKIARPDLSVWVATGDGDCMSIGGNHMIHTARRNVDINVLMFNNEVYSLTKGQYSPTSQRGQITKSSPLGVLDDPFNPMTLSLGSGATFAARAIDRDIRQMKDLMLQAHQHQGFSFLEIYTNCVIFNDGAFDKYTQRNSRKEHTVMLEHGKPLIFGDQEDKGVRLDGFRPVAVSLTDGQYSVDDLLVHDETDTTLAFILANMSFNPELPRPLGIFQKIDRSSYDARVTAQIAHAQEKEGPGELEELLKGKDSWIVN